MKKTQMKSVELLDCIDAKASSIAGSFSIGKGYLEAYSHPRVVVVILDGKPDIAGLTPKR